MNIYEWAKSVPDEIVDDIPWKIEAYRISLYLSDLCWTDTFIIYKSKRYTLADQLYRSISSISANIVEGYSRISQKDKVRFYEYALGSAREGRDWYFKARHLFPNDTYTERIAMLTSVIKLLHKMIFDQRNRR